MRINTGILFALLVILATPPQSVFAQRTWKVEKLDPKTVPKDLFANPLVKAKNGIPNGRVAVGGDTATIKKAWYSLPTRRYGHGALGDKIEGGSLVVIDRNGSQYSYQLSELEVFEDLTPRLADLDGDGKTEIITITAHALQGGSISIFQLSGNSLVRAARSKSIGQRFRWLNIAGIHRYSGHKTPEIAVVITPHIGGKLRFYKFRRGNLSKSSAIQSFSNHVFGSTEQRLSASFPVTAKGKHDLALPSAQRNSLVITSLRPSGIVARDQIKLPGKIDKAIVVEGGGVAPKFTVGLENGDVYSISRK